MQSNFLTVEFVRCHRAVRPVQGPPPTRAMRALCGPEGHPRQFVINKNKIRASELNILNDFFVPLTIYLSIYLNFKKSSL